MLNTLRTVWRRARLEARHAEVVKAIHATERERSRQKALAIALQKEREQVESALKEGK